MWSVERRCVNACSLAGRPSSDNTSLASGTWSQHDDDDEDEDAAAAAAAAADGAEWWSMPESIRPVNTSYQSTITTILDNCYNV